MLCFGNDIVGLCLIFWNLIISKRVPRMKIIMFISDFVVWLV